MRPSPVVNQIIGSVLVRGLQLYSVKLYAFVFASNHFHLILSGNPNEISRFMAHLQSNIARQVGELVDWKDKFWARRYSSEPILDDDALVGRVQYIFEHGVKEGLVSNANKWPGLTGISELTSSKKRHFYWFHKARHTAATQAGKAVIRSDFLEKLPLILHPLPQWKDLQNPEQQQLYRQTLKAANHCAKEKRNNKQALGLKKVLAQHPHQKPKRSSGKPRPLCHTTCSQLRKQFKILYREFLAAYWEASAAYLRGAFDIPFPEGTFRPPIGVLN